MFEDFGRLATFCEQNHMWMPGLRRIALAFVQVLATVVVMCIAELDFCRRLAQLRSCCCCFSCWKGLRMGKRASEKAEPAKKRKAEALNKVDEATSKKLVSFSSWCGDLMVDSN